VIERHVRLESCRATNPDVVVSMSLHGLVDYVTRVRRAEAAMGQPSAVGAQPSEEPMMAYRARDKRRKRA